VKKVIFKTLDNKLLLSLHLHEHYMSIHDYIWLYLENEEEIEVEEARTSPPPPPEEPQVGNCFYFDIYGAEPDSPITQGKPQCIRHPLVILKSFSLDASGDRSCVLNQLLHFLPWIWLLLLNP
jgi:hypothetical protein